MVGSLGVLNWKVVMVTVPVEHLGYKYPCETQRYIHIFSIDVAEIPSTMPQNISSE